MSFIMSVIVGIIQGLTEFLPVSSSGHLVLFQHFLGVQGSKDITFEIFLHLGTVLAVLVFFRKTIWDLIAALFHWKGNVSSSNHRHNRLIIVYLIMATIMTAMVYTFFGDPIKLMFSDPLLVAIMLILTGVIVFVSDLVKDSGIPAFSMGFWRSILIGLAQSFAMIPGISRSGSTISMALASGIRRRDAAQFSFLLSIPAIIGANLVSLSDLVRLDPAMLTKYLGGFVAAFVSGYLVIAALLALIQRSKLKYFAFYCWLIAGAAIVKLVLL
ncbi:MAG: undecaprenyl-diphosphate phosphatase [Candidatus Cloacimonetes bacterium]|nr:undecaprenyl-diphosphate phosphatase [Candidatus Cloacimonadota bacterium]